MRSSIADIRRRNLARLIDRDFDGNQSAMARACDPENPKPQYFNDLLRPGSGKSFGEKAARNIEARTGLTLGQLDIPDSPLTRDEPKRNEVEDELWRAIESLDRDGKIEALAAIRRIQAKRISSRPSRR